MFPFEGYEWHELASRTRSQTLYETPILSQEFPNGANPSLAFPSRDRIALVKFRMDSVHPFFFEHVGEGERIGRCLMEKNGNVPVGERRIGKMY